MITSGRQLATSQPQPAAAGLARPPASRGLRICGSRRALARRRRVAALTALFFSPPIAPGWWGGFTEVHHSTVEWVQSATAQQGVRNQRCVSWEPPPPRRPQSSVAPTYADELPERAGLLAAAVDHGLVGGEAHHHPLGAGGKMGGLGGEGREAREGASTRAELEGLDAAATILFGALADECITYQLRRRGPTCSGLPTLLATAADSACGRGRQARGAVCAEAPNGRRISHSREGRGLPPLLHRGPPHHPAGRGMRAAPAAASWTHASTAPHRHPAIHRSRAQRGACAAAAP